MTSPLDITNFEAYVHAVKAQNTALKYTQSAERFLEFLREKQIPLDRLPPGIMSSYAQYLVDCHLAPRSIHTMIAGAKSYLEWCRGQGGSIPILARHHEPKPEDKEPNALNDFDLRRYLATVHQAHEPVRTALLLMPFCGLRSEELVRLSRQSVRSVALPLRGGGHAQHVVFVVHGKGNKLRMVPVIDFGRQILMKYLQIWWRYQASDWLFPVQSEDGMVGIKTRALRHYVHRVAEHLNISRLTTHTLRRTYATALWRNGIDPVSLTKILGHRSLQTTMQHYLEVRPEDAAGATAGMRLIVRGPEEQLTIAQNRLRDYLASPESRRTGT